MDRLYDRVAYVKFITMLAWKPMIECFFAALVFKVYIPYSLCGCKRSPGPKGFLIPEVNDHAEVFLCLCGGLLCASTVYKVLRVRVKTGCKHFAVFDHSCHKLRA